MRWMIRGLALSAAGVAVGVAAGCGNLTAGGVAEATVAVSGDAPEATQGGSRAAPVSLAALVPWPGEREPRPWARFAPARPGGPAQTNSIVGEVEVEFELSLIGPGGEVVRLSDGPLRVRVDASGETEETAVRRRAVPAASYSRVRASFTEIVADVDEGLVVVGEPLTGRIEVEVAGEPLEVERNVNIDVPDGGEVELLIDLESAAWLRAADPAQKIVAGSAFRNALEVRVR